MCVQKKKYSRVKTMDDEGDDDDEKDMIADEIFTGDGDGDGEVEDGEAVDTLHTRDEEEEDDEESGRKDIYSVHHGFEFLCYNSVEMY